MNDLSGFSKKIQKNPFYEIKEQIFSNPNKKIQV